MAMTTRSKLLVVTAVMASLLEIIDTSIVNVAVPSMMGNLGSTLDEISWVLTGYIIANAIVLPIAGWMSEQLGRKLYYTTCILLFTGSSVACGLAPNLPTLVVFRVLQGLAGGALLPTSQSLIFEAFPREQAGMASAIYGMSVMIGPTIGPTLGGYLTDNFGWRSIFNINLPIGLAVAVLSFLLVEDVGFDPQGLRPVTQAKRQRTPVDALGLSLLIVGIGCMQYVLERGHADDWFDSKAILISTILAVVSLIWLIVHELRTPHPILQLKHFKNTTFRSGVFLMTGLGVSLYGLMFILPVFVATVQGLTATQTGELFIPGALLCAMMMPMIGVLLRKGDPRQLIGLGTVGLCVAFLMMSSFDSQTSVQGMFLALLVRGGAMAFLFVPINSTVLSQFSGAAIGQAAGMLNLCRQLGGSVGIAVISSLFQKYQDQNYAYLANHVTWFDHSAMHAHAVLSSGMQAKMSGLVGLGTSAVDTLKILYLKTKKEAFVISFQQILVVIALLYAMTLVPLFFMKKPKIDSGPLPDAH